MRSPSPHSAHSHLPQPCTTRPHPSPPTDPVPPPSSIPQHSTARFPDPSPICLSSSKWVLRQTGAAPPSQPRLHRTCSAEPRPRATHLPVLRTPLREQDWSFRPHPPPFSFTCCALLSPPPPTHPTPTWICEVWRGRGSLFPYLENLQPLCAHPVLGRAHLSPGQPNFSSNPLILARPQIDSRIFVGMPGSL